MTDQAGVGDIVIPKLVVDPFDGTTLATLLVIDPDGTTTPMTATTVDGGHTWETNDELTYDKPRRWLLLWTVTGTGGGAQPQSVWVVDNPGTGGAEWTPDRAQVADYVPGRTLANDLTGARLTFDDNTTPTGQMVDRMIGEAVSWVTVKTGTDIDESLWQFAGSCAAVYTAAMIERGYPTRADDLTTADALYKQAVAMRDDLAKANEAVTGDNPNDPGAGVMPMYSFPDAPDCPPSWWTNTDHLCGTYCGC